jgi:hypothetical protein
LLLPRAVGVTIPSAIEVSGDLLAAATALGGLVLVFLGSTYTSYESYPSMMRDAKVRARFRRRAWFGFAGFVLALLSALFALLGKWIHLEWCSFTGLALFIAALCWVLASALMSVRDIQ